MNKRTFLFRHMMSIVTIMLIMVVTLLIESGVGENLDTVKAAEAADVDLRFIFTSDTHGQINSKDYEMGGDFSSGGLAKAYTLIQKARDESYKNNTFTFDIGDNLFDFTTEYIFSENQKELQPVYKAVAKVGYDAITLGNHDMDYGYSYIVNQLEQAGLKNKTVVSNLIDVKEDNHPFKENMIITRNAVSSNGTTVKVKVGVIGEILKTLSSKNEDYAGTLKTDDLVNSVKEQAKVLKEQGADVVVVLSHSGMGVENPALNDDNVSYALTKIDDVDVVLCGHDHHSFPTADHSLTYYSLPGVDTKTGLVNGKNLVMASDRGTSIGVVDLKLRKNGNNYDIVNRSSEVRKVTKDTTENSGISNCFGAWEDIWKDYFEKTIANIDVNKTITNFFGLVGDNSGIQLLNDAKMAYALNYVNNVNTKYKNYNIISASHYNRYGQNSYKDYVNLSGKITESDLASMQDYNKYVALYTITGRQLREWLEWSASAYENTSTQSTWVGNAMDDVLKKTNEPSLLKAEWVDDWSKFTVFDGVEYVIDPSIEARYDKAGNKISDTNRIVNLTYNGDPVTDGTQFLLASDRITQTTPATAGLNKQYISRGYNLSQRVVSDYIKMLAKDGNVKITPDYNWKLKLYNNHQFIIKASSLSESVVSNYSWFDKKIDTFDNYNYYLARGAFSFSDANAPNIVVNPLTTVATNRNIKIAVKASDESGVAYLKYAVGSVSADSSDWSTASEITDGTFTVTGNGIFTIYAQDRKGNRKVVEIAIDNINSTILQKPKVNTYTNRKTKITGMAEPLSTIYFETADKTYQSNVSADGTFSYALPAQLANSKFNVYVKDASGRQSEKTVVKVKYTGPNSPTIKTFTNKVRKVSGDTRNKSVKLYAIIDNDVYVSKNGGIEAFEQCEKYNANLNIIETDITIASDGMYNITVPLQLPGTKVSIYSIDYLNRVSRVNTVTTKDVAPNAPTIYDVTNIERTIYGTVNNTSDTKVIYDIVVTIGENEYSGVTDEDGNYAIPVGKLSVGDVVKVNATDEVGGKSRTSYTSTKKVENISNYYDPKAESFVIGTINNKQYSISGYYEDGSDSIFISINNKVYQVDTDVDGNFELDIDNTLSEGTPIYIYSRYVDGGMIEAQCFTVALAKPDTPYITKSKITNATKVLKVITDKGSLVTVKVRDKKYTTKKYTYDSKLDAYVYTVVIPRTNSGAEVKIYASNKAGYSSGYTTEIVETAPDTPVVKTVYEKKKVITGKVDIVYYNESGVDQVTKIYAQIGNKVYKGKVDENGNYKIKIPAVKKGTKIYVWGENLSGRGPTKVVTVVKSKK